MKAILLVIMAMATISLIIIMGNGLRLHHQRRRWLRSIKKYDKVMCGDTERYVFQIPFDGHIWLFEDPHDSNRFIKVPTFMISPCPMQLDYEIIHE